MCVCVYMRMCICVSLSRARACVYGIHVPQSAVLGHCLGGGFVSGSQLVVLQRTAPAVPDAPSATPHFVAHLVAASGIQLPKETVVSNDREGKERVWVRASVCSVCVCGCEGVNVCDVNSIHFESPVPWAVRKRAPLSCARARLCVCACLCARV